MATGERFSHRFGLEFQTYDDPLSSVEIELFESAMQNAQQYASLDQDSFAIMFEGGIVTGNRVTGTKDEKSNPTWKFDVKHGTLEEPKRTHLFVGYRPVVDPKTWDTSYAPLLLISGAKSQTPDGDVASWNVFTETPENIQAMNIVIDSLSKANSVLQGQNG